MHASLQNQTKINYNQNAHSRKYICIKHYEDILFIDIFIFLSISRGAILFPMCGFSSQLLLLDHISLKQLLHQFYFINFFLLFVNYMNIQTNKSKQFFSSIEISKSNPNIPFTNFVLFQINSVLFSHSTNNNIRSTILFVSIWTFLIHCHNEKSINLIDKNE